MRMTSITILATVLLTASRGHAGLIGDAVTAAHAVSAPSVPVPFDENPTDGPHFTVVTSGNSDLVNLTASLDGLTDYTVDFAAAGFEIEFVRPVNFTAGTLPPFFHGVIAGDLDAGSPILGVVVASNNGFDANRVSFAPREVRVNFQGLTIGTGTQIDVLLQIPEPTVIVAVMLGTPLFVGRRRRAR